MIPARGLELCLEDGRDQGDASPLRAGRRLQILMVVQELDVEQGDALRRFGWRVRRRADANGEGPEDEERGNPRCGERSATRREQSFAPGKAWAAAGLGRDSRRRPSFRNPSSFHPFPAAISRTSPRRLAAGLVRSAGPSQYKRRSDAIGNRADGQNRRIAHACKVVMGATARGVCRRSAGWIGHRGVGADSGRYGQDRRLERLLRPIRRSGRQGVAGGRSTRGRGFRQGGGRPQGRGHLRRSSEQARHRRGDCAAMGGSGGRRRDRRPRQFRRRSRRQHASCTRRIARCSHPQPRPRI